MSMKMKPPTKNWLTSRQIKRRGYEAVTYYDNGWRYGYIVTWGRQWASGSKAGDGLKLRLRLNEEGKGWKRYAL